MPAKVASRVVQPIRRGAWVLLLVVASVAMVGVSALSLKRLFDATEPSQVRGPAAGGLAPRTVRGELTETSAAIVKAGAPTPTLWRPPFNRTSAEIDALAYNLGMGKAGWNIDPHDYDFVNKPAIVARNALEGAFDEGVILLHDGHAPPRHDETTLRALPRIIDGLRARGYCLGTLGVVEDTVTILSPKGCAKAIALTFDDGPDSVVTPKILDVLRAKRVRATFFVKGVNVKQYPDIVRRMARDGNVVGNHTWTHPDLLELWVQRRG